MKRAGLAIGLAATLAACSPQVTKDDIPGVYAGTLENRQTYRLELGEALDYRFCPPDDTQCTSPEHSGSYQVLKLGARSIVRFELLCIAPDGACKTYEADANRGREGSIELRFLDAEGGTSAVFERRSDAD